VFQPRFKGYANACKLLILLRFNWNANWNAPPCFSSPLLGAETRNETATWKRGLWESAGPDPGGSRPGRGSDPAWHNRPTPPWMLPFATPKPPPMQMLA